MAATAVGILSAAPAVGRRTASASGCTSAAVSLAASLAAEEIRHRARVEVPAEAPTAALLHDFGKVVLAQHFGARVLNMLAQAAVARAMILIFGLSWRAETVR